LNYFKKQQKRNVSIDKRYSQKCIYFNELIKSKLKSKKEKCLDAISIDEDEKNNSFELKHDEINSKYINLKTIQKSFSVVDRNIRKRGKTMKLSNNITKYNEINKNKDLTTKGSNKVIGILKKYQFKRDTILNYKLNNLKTSLDAATKTYLKQSNNSAQKIKNRNSCLMRSSSTFATNKINSFRKYLKLNNEIMNEKNSEEAKIKSSKNMHKFETPQKFYQYLSSKKLINNFPKVEKIKKLNLFQKNSQISLNSIEQINIFPLILPNLAKINKKKERNEATSTKNFIKIRILK
jgi:hypothetical protein